MAANSLKTSKTPLGEYFRKKQAKKDYIPAIVATVNKLAKIIYTMVKYKVEYDEKYLIVNNEDMLKKKLLRTQKAMEKIEKQLNEVVKAHPIQENIIP